MPHISLFKNVFCFCFQDNKVSHSQFDVICGLVSWATCGSGLSRKRREQINDSKQAKKSKSQIGNENSDSLKDDVYQLHDGESGVNVKEFIGDIKDTVKVSENIEDTVKTTENLDKSVIIKEKSEDIGSSKETYYDEDMDDEYSESEDEKEVNSTEGKYHVSITKHLGLSMKQREDIGFKAKAILDWGRLLYLRGKNFDTNLCFYVDKALSPENVCIVAKKNSS